MRHTTHVDRINLVPLRIHLIDNMSSLKSDCLLSAHNSVLELSSHTSRAMLNFLAKSFTLSSRVNPVIIPFIFESARGDLFPDYQLSLASLDGVAYRAILSAYITVKGNELTKSG